jgi:hypothetical protein
MSRNAFASSRWTFAPLTLERSRRVAGKCSSSLPIATAAFPISASVSRICRQVLDSPAATESAVYTARPTVR